MKLDPTSPLSEFGIQTVYHIAPLHYFPFISRAAALLARSNLQELGYGDWHFRRTSHRADAARGFSDRIYLSPWVSPPILNAKLARGFPHIQFEIPIAALSSAEFDLCRFAVARTRYLRRGTKSGPEASPTNGRYYGTHQLPVARMPTDMRAMLAKHFLRGDAVEVQVKSRLPLPNNTTITCFSQNDLSILQQVTRLIQVPWELKVSEDRTYCANPDYVGEVERFVRIALNDCTWKGNGLDFDRLI